MHIPDGFVSGPINTACGLAAAGVVGASAWRAARMVERHPRVMPLLATTGSFVFAAQMLNFPIGGGTSGHFMGAAVIAALLGPWSACLVMALVLIIQCFGFADGGLTALGTNIVNMGVIGGFSSYGLMRLLRPVLPAGRTGYLVAVAIAGWTSIVLAATACALELAWSGTSPLVVVLPAMAGSHAIIGIGEALITVAVLSAVLAARPDVVPQWAGVVETKAAVKPQRKRPWALAAWCVAFALFIGGAMSPLASTYPDGLEKVAEAAGFAESAESSRHWNAPLPDYAVPGVQSEPMATRLAGILGTLAVFGAGLAVIKLATWHTSQRES